MPQPRGWDSRNFRSKLQRGKQAPSVETDAAIRHPGNLQRPNEAARSVVQGDQLVAAGGHYAELYEAWVRGLGEG